MGSPHRGSPIAKRLAKRPSRSVADSYAIFERHEKRRPVAFAAKARKDIAQATEVLDVLLTDRPRNVPAATQAFEQHGERREKAMAKALAVLKRERPDLAKAMKTAQ